MTTQQYAPIAGCGSTADADAAPYGGRWLLLDQDGQMLVAAANPKLAQIAVQLRFGYLALRAPGMLRLDIPLDVIEDDDSVRSTQALPGGRSADVIDEGPLAAAWFSDFLGQPCRLMKLHPDEAGWQQA